MTAQLSQKVGKRAVALVVKVILRLPTGPKRRAREDIKLTAQARIRVVAIAGAAREQQVRRREPLGFTQVLGGAEQQRSQLVALGVGQVGQRQQSTASDGIERDRQHQLWIIVLSKHRRQLRPFLIPDPLTVAV